MDAALAAAAAALVVALLARVAWLLPLLRRQPAAARLAGATTRVLVVLGSGGHTAEMLRLVAAVRARRAAYGPWHYVVAQSDTTSVGRLERAEPGGGYAVTRLRRAREVGQPWLASAWTTALALPTAVAAVHAAAPDLVLVNGPGTCVPVAAAAFLLRVLGLGSARIVFAESFCRVTSLSLTGKLLYPVADRFVVLWPELAERYSRAEFMELL